MLPAPTRRLAAASLLAAALYVPLALADLVPGGWRLRTLVTSPAELAEAVRQEHRAERMAAFEADPGPRDGVLFIGSSTIEYLDLAAAFPGARTVNRGIGDEDLAGLEERFDETLRATRCRAVVLYAGSVDFRRHRLAPGLLAGRVGALLDAAAAAPGAPRVVLLGILPERRMDPPMAERLLATNRALEALAGARDGVSFVSTARPPLVDPRTGRLAEATSRDAIHLNGRGYRVAVDWILAADDQVAALLRP